MTEASVCVVVAAWNAESTIARAVGSALAEPEVAEVVVVDDACTDATVAAASAACDGSGRLRVLRQADNRGPAAARNRAIADSTAPLIALLDADDFFVPGRFAHLASLGPDCDAAFDNIAFVTEAALPGFDMAVLRDFPGRVSDISLAEFVGANLARPGRARAELGFIKPVMSRRFLEASGIIYDETLRLGEDYILYARMLAAGATVQRSDRVGYVAVERAGSLSGRHSADDLAALLTADLALLDLPELTGAERSALRRHADQLADKVHYRRLLDEKSRRGFGPAIAAAVSAPSRLPSVVASYARDKLAKRPAPDPFQPVRYLFD